MDYRVIQIGTVGAMQRAHPALTRLWLQWTGIPGLETAEFNLAKPEHGSNPATQIRLAPKVGVYETWGSLCDFLDLPADAAERRKMPIYLPPRDPSHRSFWEKLRKREMEDVDGPIEWWWRLMVMRFKGVQRASKVLIREAIGDHDGLDTGVISFQNPSLLRTDKPGDKIIESSYTQPTHVVVSFRVKRDVKIEGLAFDLGAASFKGHFVSKLIELATIRH